VRIFLSLLRIIFFSKIVILNYKTIIRQSKTVNCDGVHVEDVTRQSGTLCTNNMFDAPVIEIPTSYFYHWFHFLPGPADAGNFQPLLLTNQQSAALTGVSGRFMIDMLEIMA